MSDLRPAVGSETEIVVQKRTCEMGMGVGAPKGLSAICVMFGINPCGTLLRTFGFELIGTGCRYKVSFAAACMVSRMERRARVR